MKPGGGVRKPPSPNTGSRMMAATSEGWTWQGQRGQGEGREGVARGSAEQEVEGGGRRELKSI